MGPDKYQDVLSSKLLLHFTSPLQTCLKSFCPDVSSLLDLCLLHQFPIQRVSVFLTVHHVGGTSPFTYVSLHRGAFQWPGLHRSNLVQMPIEQERHCVGLFKALFTRTDRFRKPGAVWGCSANHTFRIYQHHPWYRMSEWVCGALCKLYDLCMEENVIHY